MLMPLRDNNDSIKLFNDQLILWFDRNAFLSDRIKQTLTKYLIIKI